MEIKTCEQYVVSKLMELENEVESQSELIAQMANKIRTLQEHLNYVKKFASVQTIQSDGSGRKYITFDNIYSNYDKEDFTKMCEIFNFCIEEEDANEKSTDSMPACS